MAGYIGTRCIVCSEKFTSDDDVVICPECGTPYHRECYKKEGKCVNTVLHQRGGSWKPSYDTGSDSASSEAVTCRFCGNVNPPLTLFCRRCGMPVSSMENDSDHAHRAGQFYRGVNINENPGAYNQNANGGVQFNPFLINFSDPLCGYSPDEDLDGVKMSEMGDFVGSNTHYYLPIFKRFKETHKSVSWNFTAMLFPEYYFAYRKMPLAALGAFILHAVSMLPVFIVYLSQFAEFGALSAMASSVDTRGTAFQGFMMICNAILYSLMFLSGLFGNRLYYNSALRKIKKVKETESGMILRQTLVKKGGTSALLMVLFICLTAVPYIALCISQFSAALSSMTV
ncbi:MAG: DUF2628 domain-containing protein [Oscillospiraceae bacterium]|nr:DUF2628 domain-containing protein [Oscillospiraceae bacterium]